MLRDQLGSGIKLCRTQEPPTLLSPTRPDSLEYRDRRYTATNGRIGGPIYLSLPISSSDTQRFSRTLCPLHFDGQQVVYLARHFLTD